MPDDYEERLEKQLSSASNEEVLRFMVQSYQGLVRKLENRLLAAIEDGHKWDKDALFEIALCQWHLGHISIAYDHMEYKTHQDWYNAQKYSGETMWEGWDHLLYKAGVSSEEVHAELNSTKEEI